MLGEVSERTGCKMLLAQKAFSIMTAIDFLSHILQAQRPVDYLRHDSEQRKCREKRFMYSVQATADEFEELLQYADHIVFNSPSQLLRFGAKAKVAGKSVGLRINPECSTQEGHEIYDPCAPGSRMGTTRAQWMKHFKKIRNFWICSMAFTSILSASRTPMTWRQLLFQ